MTFGNPLWLLLIFPLLALLPVWPPLRRTTALLRVGIMVLIVAALADLRINRTNGDGVVVMIADRSLSMPSDGTVRLRDAFDILNRSMPVGNRLGIVSFAADSTIEKMPQSPSFDGFKAELNRNQSNLKGAIETALALIPQGAPGRLVLLSDGAWTGSDPSGIFAVSAARGIAVDYRHLQRAQVNDLAISEIQAPVSSPAGSFFTIGIVVRAPQVMSADYVLTRGRRPLAAGKIQLKAGDNHFFFKDLAVKPQVLSYVFSITPPVERPDPRLENNRADFLVKVTGARPVLLLTMNKKSLFGTLLQESGIEVQVRTPQEVEFSIAGLAGYSAVILENVPAARIGTGGLATIAAMVQNGSTGLLTTGGKNAYALGGYFKSPLDEVMPVSMELKREHRKLSMAIVVVLDRSGSMAASVGDGKTKIDLANLATVEVMNMLSPVDEFGVFAVDSIAHEVVPLVPVSEAKGFEGKILHIQSMGGGIFVYEALKAAVKMLVGAKAGTRHIVLFADAADAEQPGNYKELLTKCEAAGITVSVIGLGLETDCDAEFLRDVALRGNGQCFFTVNPGELPRLFAQDTFVISRNTFIDTPVKVELDGSLRMISRRDFGVSFTIGGYNFTTLKPDARAGAVSADEHHAPILAFWYSGNGRAMAYTGEIDGEFTGPFASWPRAGDLLAAMTMWVAGLGDNRLPAGMMITQELDHGIHRIRLHLDPHRRNDSFSRLPEITTLSGLQGQHPRNERNVMKWETPDTLVLEVPLQGAESSLSTVHIDNAPPQVLAPVMLPYSPEFHPADTVDGVRATMPHLCRLSGGKERIDLAGIWSELPCRVTPWPIAPWLIMTAILLLLLEVLERRTAIVSRVFVRIPRETVQVAVAPVPSSSTQTSTVPQSVKKKKNVSVPISASKSETIVKEKKASSEEVGTGLFEAMDRVKNATRRKR